MLNSPVLYTNKPFLLLSVFYFTRVRTKTYWPAGGGRGRNPENTAQGNSVQNPIRPESCPPGQPPEGRIASLGAYRVLNRVPAGRIFSTGRALGRDLCDKDFVLVRLQQANMCYIPLSRFTGSVECCITIILLSSISENSGGMYDLAGSKFKIWPTKCDLEVDDLEKN